MSNVPANLKYTASHEWVRDEGDNIVTIGITDHAQELLGDLVFVELPEIGTHAYSGGEIAVVESVKAASDVYSPLDGEVTAVNEALVDAPEQVNESAYDDGWLFKLKLADDDALGALMNAQAYTAHLESEEH